MSYTTEFSRRGLINAPAVILESQIFEVKMGSLAFGTASPDSDVDVYGFFVPPPSVLQEEFVNEFRALHLLVDEGAQSREYDLVLFSVDKFFERCVAGKPQSLETLFVDEANIICASPAARIVRARRKAFLSKAAARDFRYFASLQLEGLISRSWTDGKRGESIARFGYDVKAGYHIVRLMHEAKQLLVEGDLDLKRNASMLLDIRAGRWTEQEIIACFKWLDVELEQLYQTTSLPDVPNAEEVATLLQLCKTAKQGWQDTAAADETRM